MKNTRALNKKIMDLAKSGVRVKEMALMRGMPTADEICDIIANDEHNMFATMELRDKSTVRLKYNETIASEILDRVVEGETISKIGRIEYMPSHMTIRSWIIENKDGFGDAYKYAQKLRIQFMTEEVLDIADDSTNDYVEKASKDGTVGSAFDREHVQRSKLRVDARLKIP